MADCKKCPISDECDKINTNLKNKGRIPPTLTFCPLKFAVELAGNNFDRGDMSNQEIRLRQKRWTL